MVENKKENIIPCVFYFYLHYKLYNGILSKEASLKDIKKYLFQWKIPKKLKPLIIKELEILGLIKLKGRYIVEFNKPKFNEESYNDYYHLLGFY